MGGLAFYIEGPQPWQGTWVSAGGPARCPATSLPEWVLPRPGPCLTYDHCGQAWGGTKDTLGCCSFLNKFIYLFLVALGLRCCTWAFSTCGERGLLFVAVHGLLIAVASLVAEHGL